MRTKYPHYAMGELQEKEKKLSPKNKKILKEFATICSTTAGKEKVVKIRRILVQFYDVTGLDFDMQTKDSVNTFLAVLNNSDRSIPTKNEIKSYLKKFLKWFYKDLEMIENIKRESFDVNTAKINDNTLATEEDIKRMLRYAEGFRDKALLFIEFQSGARPQEIVNLTWGDVKFQDNCADLNFYSGKTKKSRTFPLVKEAKTFLWEWKQHYLYENINSKDFVFPSRFSRDKPMTTANVNKILRTMAKKSGIKKDIWGYLFRHTRATRLYEELPTPIVEQLLGHRDMYNTYAHISNKKAREELLKKMGELEELPPEQKEKLEALQRRVEELEKMFKNSPKDQERWKKESPKPYI